MAYIPCELNLEVLKFLSRIEIENLQLTSKNQKVVVQRFSAEWPEYVPDKIVAEVVNGERILKAIHQGQECILLRKVTSQQNWQVLNQKLWAILPHCWFREMRSYPDVYPFFTILQV
jgi:hypothetical protein